MNERAWQREREKTAESKRGNEEDIEKNELNRKMPDFEKDMGNISHERTTMVK